MTEDSVLTPITILLQNKNLAFQEQQGIHRAVVHVYGKITGVTGRVAPGGVFEDTISQDIPDALFKQSLEAASIHQKVIPLRPGLYKLDLVLKDINSGNVGTVSQRLQVPRYPDEKLQLSSLILADLVENLRVEVLSTGGRAVQVELPASVQLKVVEAPEGLRGDTASNVTKQAVLETGKTVNVPLFIQEGEVVKIDTRTGAYMGRA